MSKRKNWIKSVVIIFFTCIVIVGGFYLYIQYKINQIKSTLNVCEVQQENFKTTIPFNYVKNWIIVKVRFGVSDKEYDFIVDTGSPTVFSDSLIREVGHENFSKIAVITDTSSHAFNDYVVTTDDLNLGGISFNHVGALVVNNSEFGMLNCISPYGIIGYNILQVGIYQIDYLNNQITITDQLDSLRNVGTIQWVNYTTISQETPVIRASLNDSISLNLTFDTGYSGFITLSSQKLFEKLNICCQDQTARYHTIPTIKITRTHETESYEKLLFKGATLSVDSIEVKDIIVPVSNTPESPSSNLIGNKFFEHFLLTLDYRNKRVGFTPNGKRFHPEESTGFGFSFSPEGYTLIITSVYVGTEAEKIGLQPGDTIHSINDLVISELNTSDFCQIFRNEIQLINEQDTLITLGVWKHGQICRHNFLKIRLL